MHSRITRRTFGFLPVAHPLMRLHTPEASPAAIAEEPGAYEHPDYLWTIAYNTDRWELDDTDPDAVVLTSKEEWVSGATVTFHTSPLDMDAVAVETPEPGDPARYLDEPGPLEARLLEVRQQLEEETEADDVVVTVGEDHLRRAIYGLFHHNEQSDPADDQWIASYAVRNLADPETGLVVEVDSIGMSAQQGVLVIVARSDHAPYEQTVYDEVEMIRESLYAWFKSQPSATGTGGQISMLARRTSGGTRPKVQY